MTVDWAALTAVTATALRASPVCEDVTYNGSVIRAHVERETDEDLVELPIERAHVLATDVRADPVGDVLEVYVQGVSAGAAVMVPFVVTERTETGDGWLELGLVRQ